MYVEGVKAYLYLGFKKFDIIVCFIQHRHYIHLQFVMTRNHAIILIPCFFTKYICDHEKQHIKRNCLYSYRARVQGEQLRIRSWPSPHLEPSPVMSSAFHLSFSSYSVGLRSNQYRCQMQTLWTMKNVMRGYEMTFGHFGQWNVMFWVH